jgi:hypothetical protein
MFRTIFSPSSGSQVYNVALVILLLLRLLSAGLDEKGTSHPGPQTFALKVKEVLLPHLTLGLLIMG